ncbi:thioredoxin-like protein [Mucor mucedo]|uniref:thioredoxin-like protein n=1 Tax=Mucor mucedo TaxID=29922 RepID=UPI00222006DA|nr:thioredoxin-like protein [Mucor mucedo]KAI7892010.1 thioredoxin-like protein [Mucor mucedo]
MLKKTVLLSAIACLLTSCTVATQDVLTLNTREEFDAAINTHELLLMKFFAPWCARSKELIPEYATAATLLKEDNITLAEIDCTVNNVVCDRYGLLAYPTMQIFRKGRASDVYPHERTTDGIVKFMKKHLTPTLSLLENTQDLDTLKKDESILAVAYVDPKDTTTLEQWRELSDRLHADYAFGYVTDPSFAKSQKVTEFPTIRLYKHFDDLQDTFTGSVSEAEDFIKLNAVPLLDTIRPETFMDYVDAGRPLVFLFSNSDEMQQELHNRLLPLVKAYKGKFSFAHIDATEYISHAEFLSLRPNEWPAMGIHNFKTGARFPFDQQGDLALQDVDSIQAFLDKVHENKVKPVYKSQTPSKEVTKEDPVKIVVGDDFEKVVLDKSKDVFIEIYAPWCGHCRALEPIWKQLGKVMQDNEAEKHDLVVAKMDGTVNDVPLSAGFQVTGYPTIKFFKAQDNTMISYKGGRTLYDLVEFLNEHSSTQTLHIDLDSLSKYEDTEEVPRDEL